VGDFGVGECCGRARGARRGDRELSGSAVHAAEWDIGDTAVSSGLRLSDRRRCDSQFLRQYDNGELQRLEPVPRSGRIPKSLLHWYRGPNIEKLMPTLRRLQRPSIQEWRLQSNASLFPSLCVFAELKTSPQFVTKGSLGRDATNKLSVSRLCPSPYWHPTSPTMDYRNKIWARTRLGRENPAANVKNPEGWPQGSRAFALIRQRGMRRGHRGMEGHRKACIRTAIDPVGDGGCRSSLTTGG
jgi:hypothetical protein